jgi:hypothetical protein
MLRTDSKTWLLPRDRVLKRRLTLGFSSKTLATAVDKNPAIKKKTGCEITS